jgi:hypothetical protein
VAVPAVALDHVPSFLWFALAILWLVFGVVAVGGRLLDFGHRILDLLRDLRDFRTGD